VSSDALGLDVDMARVLDRSYVGDVGVEHGALLLAFTNAVQIGTPDPVAARAQLRDAVGAEGLHEAAATVAVFNGLVRVADGTGIQLDAGVSALSADDRERLGIDGFAGAANGTATGSFELPDTITISALFGDAASTTTGG
jgi:hypothetical protein